MKKLASGVMLLLIILSLLCSAAFADVIYPMASTIDPEHLEKTACYARILGYDPMLDTLTVELTTPEVFRRDEVLALQPGDSIYTGGKEILIETIERNDEYGYVAINGNLSREASVYLHESRYSYDGDYMPERYGNYTWNTLAVIECPVTDSLLFLDYIDENAAGDALALPIVYTARELKEKLMAEQASDAYFIGLAIDNAYVVFDGEGNLATIQRYFVSWE